MVTKRIQRRKSLGRTSRRYKRRNKRTSVRRNKKTSVRRTSRRHKRSCQCSVCRRSRRRQFGGYDAVKVSAFGGVGSDANQAMQAGSDNTAMQAEFNKALSGGSGTTQLNPGPVEVPQFTTAGNGANVSPINANTLSASLNATLQQAGANAELDGRMPDAYVQ